MSSSEEKIAEYEQQIKSLQIEIDSLTDRL